MIRPLLQALPFVAYVALGLRIPRIKGARERRLAVKQWLLYIFVVHLTVAITQVDAWPISPHRQMAVDARRYEPWRTMIAFRAFDRQGREWRVDPTAWSPLFPPPVMNWFLRFHSRADDDQRTEVMAFLLSRAERARQARRTGEPFGNTRLLGPLAAPDIFPWWQAAAPDAPFVGLRVYSLRWTPRALLADPSSVQRRLLAEYPAP